MKNSIKTFALAAVVATSIFSCTKDDLKQDGFASSRTGESILGAVATKVQNTGQSIMVDISGDDILYQILGEEKWQFDDEAGAEYFSGGTLNDRKQVAKSQRCTFWSGGILQSEVVGGGKQAVTITPISSTNSIAAQTAWELMSSSGGATTIDASINFSLAALSANNNKQKGGTKYSLSLTKERIENLTIELLKEGVILNSKTILPEEYNLITGSITSSMVYTAAAGQYFGNASLVTPKDGQTFTAILGSSAWGDKTVNDNNAAYVTLPSALIYQLGEGTYSVKVSGNIKGNGLDFSAQSFNVTKSFEVNADRCSVSDEVTE